MVTKTSLLLGYQCNNNCRFCYCQNKKEQHRPMSTEQAKKELEKGYERGSDYVDFLGGEPSIRKDITELVKYAKEIGFEEIAMTTNGKMFSYRDFAEEIVDAGLNHVIFSLHGHRPEIHNFLVRDSNGFQLLKEGVRNLVGVKPDLYVCYNTVINTRNIENLHRIPETGNGFVERDIDAIEFIFPHPKGGAWENFEQVVPRLEKVNEPVKKAINNAEKEGYDHIVGRYIPYCHMNGVEEFVSETMARENEMSEQHVGPEFKNLDVESSRVKSGKVKAERCKECVYDDRCEGVWREYAKKRGLEELEPVKEGDVDG